MTGKAIAAPCFVVQWMMLSERKYASQAGRESPSVKRLHHRGKEILIVNRVASCWFRACTPNHYNNLLTRIDIDRLSENTAGVKRTSMDRVRGGVRNPPHIAVVDLLAPDDFATSRLVGPIFREKSFLSHHAAVHEKKSEAAIIAQSRAQPTTSDLLTIRRLKPPRRVRLHAEPRPYALREVLRDRSFHCRMDQFSD